MQILRGFRNEEAWGVQISLLFHSSASACTHARQWTVLTLTIIVLVLNIGQMFRCVLNRFSEPVGTHSHPALSVCLKALALTLGRMLFPFVGVASLSGHCVPPSAYLSCVLDCSPKLTTVFVFLPHTLFFTVAFSSYASCGVLASSEDSIIPNCKNQGF